MIFIALFISVCGAVFIFCNLRHTFYRKTIGISEVIDVLGYCVAAMWVIAEQPDINIIRLANLFSSEMF